MDEFPWGAVICLLLIVGVFYLWGTMDIFQAPIKKCESTCKKLSLEMVKYQPPALTGDGECWCIGTNTSERIY